MTLLFCERNIMHDISIGIILRYLDEYVLDPTTIFSEDSRLEQSYSKWAAFEIIKRLRLEIEAQANSIEGRQDKSPVRIVMDFESEMNAFAVLGGPRKSAIIFEVARSTARDILYLITM